VSPPVTPERLVPQLRAWLERPPRRPVFAVHHEGEWTGGEQVVVDGTPVAIRVCPSELAVREALGGHRAGGEPLVLLTAADRLGSDVLARLAKPRVHRLQPLEALIQLFDVREIDPELGQNRWLIDALVDSAPAEGYERSGGRTLDLARAWRALLRHRHGIDPDAGLGGLLDWASTARRGRLLEALEEERDAVVEQLVPALPGSSGIVAAALAGAGDDALALGLVSRVLVAADETAALVAARTRFEARLGGWSFDTGAASAWADAAERRLVSSASDDRAELEALQAADRILGQLGADDLAGHSKHLMSGLRQRLSQLGTALERHLDGEAPISEIAGRVDAVKAHRLSRDAAATAEMALRLARWLATADDHPSDARVAAARFASDGGYADWARGALREGTAEPALSAALRRLVQAADERRDAEEGRFANLLAEWVPHAALDDGFLGVEHVLDRVVAPLSSARPVLMIVLDGMSHRVAAELLEDAVRSGWTELRRTDRPNRALVASALPSVTALSRTSLLSGQLQRGTAKDEATAFSEHAALVKASARGGAPILSHKRAIKAPHGGLEDDLSAEVTGGRQVVGVVVNAIDDHLARSEQLSMQWSTKGILPLGWLLEAARDAGRIVVLASDHGHVLEHGTELRRSTGESGERWRSGGDPPTEGEISVAGPRVLAAGGRCVLAWSERVRYAPKKNGYHGGASAQEVVAPLIVLAPSAVDGLEGWSEAPYDPPAWWLGEAAAAPPPSSPVTPPQPTRGEQLALDRQAAASHEQPSWIADLFASDLFAAQRSSAGRTPLPDDRIAAILTALDARGGRMLREALARACDIPPLRLTGTLAAMRALLNVDGYAVIAVEDASGDVTLDRALLVEQFGLRSR